MQHNELKTALEVIKRAISAVPRHKDEEWDQQLRSAWILARDAQTSLGNADTPVPINRIVQVVIFASQGVTRSVAVRPLPSGDAPCIVVDYDERHGRDDDTSPEDYERECIGCTRDEFDRTGAVYVW